MSADRDEGGFLSRWSRRKLAAKARAAPAPDPVQAVAPAAALPAADMPVAETPPLDLPAPDLSAPDLPPVESLGASSDYTAFLQKGVAAEIQRRALQRAWESDPAIAGFRGMADYDWDFNAVGYGRLSPGDNVAQLLSDVLGLAQEEEKHAEPVVAEQPVVTAHSSVRVSTPPPPEPETLPEPDPAEAKPVPVRRHGSAMPSFEDERSQRS